MCTVVYVMYVNFAVLLVLGIYILPGRCTLQLLTVIWLVQLAAVLC